MNYESKFIRGALGHPFFAEGLHTSEGIIPCIHPEPESVVPYVVSHVHMYSSEGTLGPNCRDCPLDFEYSMK